MSCGDGYVGYPCFCFDATAAVDRGVPSICAVLWVEWVEWVEWVAMGSVGSVGRVGRGGSYG